MLELFIRIFQGFSLFSFQCSVSLSFFVISDSSFILPRCLLFVNNFFNYFIFCFISKASLALKYIRIACLHFSISTVRKSPIQCVSRISLTIITPLSVLVNILFIFILRNFFAFVWRNNLFPVYYDILILYIVLFLITNTICIDLI